MSRIDPAPDSGSPLWAVRVPASSANVGAGFDVLGVALGIMAYVGVGEPPLGATAADEQHPATVAFRRAGGTGALWTRSTIPMGRGLGFSGAVRVGGAAAAVFERSLSDSTTGDEFDTALSAEQIDEILAIAVDLEGHADNAAASLYGGVVVAADALITRVPLAFDPATVVWIPDDVTTSTDRSRGSLGDSVERGDAVFNLGRVATFVAACAIGDESRLDFATQDRLHQAQRLLVSPKSANALEAAREAGVWAAWLSGSGPSIAMWCESARADEVAAALPSDGHTKIVRIAHDGTAVERLSASDPFDQAATDTALS